MRTSLAIAATVSCFSPNMATAHEVDLRALSNEVRLIDVDLDSLRQRLVSGDDTMETDEAARAYEDSIAAHMLEDYDIAAQGFFVLMAQVADPEVHAEAEWYLADSLLRAGHDRLAEDGLRTIISTPNHPYAESAAASLLELVSTKRSPSAFTTTYDDLARRGLTDATRSLVYTAGKSLLLAGDLARARRTLEGIGLDDPHAARAQYLLATIDVHQHDLPSATARFSEVAARPVTAADQAVIDLARLAVARIAYEQGEYLSAAETYSGIGAASPLLQDALYELAWTHIARGDLAAALQSVDVYLMSFPDTPRSGRMALVRGHLQMQQEEWDEASISYNTIDMDFVTIEDVIHDLPPERVVEIAAAPASESLPDWVVAELHAGPAFAQATSVWTGLNQASTDLAQADVTAVELELSLDTGIELKRHRRLRGGLFGLLQRLGDAMASVCQLQIEVLSHHDRDGRARARLATPKLQALQHRLLQLESHEDVLHGRQSAVPKVLDAVQGLLDLVQQSRPTPDAHASHAALDVVIESLQVGFQSTQHALQTLQTEAEQTSGPLRVQLDEHQDELGRLRLAHAAMSSESLDARERAVNVGVQRVQGILDDGIREARSGMADAAFSLLVEQMASREELQVRRQASLNDLEDLFDAAQARQGTNSW